MKFCYQVATPDVAIAPLVTAYQGSLEETFSALGALGYDGVELMTLDPSKLDWNEVKSSAEKYGLTVVLVCTGEVFGQLGISFTDQDDVVREQAIQRVCGIIDFAGFLGANINIGRVRGQYQDNVPKNQTWDWAVEAFRRISDYAKQKKVIVAIETVTIMQTNFINTVAEAVEMIKDVDRENFRMMADVFHFNLEEKDLIEAIRRCAPYNVHVHLADNNRRYPGHCGIDFEKVISTFFDSGYNGAFCTEIYQIPDQASAARGAMEHLSPIFSKVYGRKCKSIEWS